MSNNDSITIASSRARPPASASASASGRGSAVKRERPAVEVDTGTGLSAHNVHNGAHSAAGAFSNSSRQSTPASANGPEPSKKRKTMPGSRGVANLTPEQLAKKRANDREAQRAIRERTKLTIETLEAKIQELTSQQPYQDLQAALRAKEAVEAENADIKRRLAAVMAMIQPMVTGSASASASAPDQPAVLPSPSPNQSFMPLLTSTTPGPQSAAAHNMSTPSSADHDSPQTTADQYAQWNSSASTSSGPSAPRGQAYRERLDQQRHELAHGLEMGSERLGLGFLLDQANGATRSKRVACELSGHQQALALHNNIDPALQHAVDPIVPATVDCTLPVKNCPPTCPLDNLLLDFLNERRHRQAQGFPSMDIVGPRYPSVSSLLNPLRETHPLSKVFIDILQTFPNINKLPEKTAVLYAMFLVMRWQIDPTQDNFERLPEWLRPLPTQLYNSHPAWIDHLAWPAMRDKLIRDYPPPDVFPFENFFVPLTSTLSINWPYEDTDTLLQAPESDELLLNPVFERHVRRLENWTLGDAFARAFPMLDGAYRLKPGCAKVRGTGAAGGSATTFANVPAANIPDRIRDPATGSSEG